MMKTIVVSKTGMSFCTRAEAAKNSATGEQGETEGVLRHLMSRGDCRVVFFGAARGDMSELCHRHVTPNVSRIREDAEQSDLDTGWAEDATEMSDEHCVGMINMAGPPATFSYPGNPKGSQVQLQGMKYTAPILRMCEEKQMPRCVINCDPRTYPRDQEMSYGWKWARPRALLDQCRNEQSMIVGGVEYDRISVYAGCESWAWLPRRDGGERSRCHVVAHAHIRDGIRQKSRSDSWFNVLGPPSEWPEGFTVTGAGWFHYAGYESIDTRFRAACTPQEALDIFHRTQFTPCVAAAPGFYTGKPYVAFSQGCVPILYGDGNDPYTWDPYGRLLPLDSPLRIVKPGDLWKPRDYEAEKEFWAGKLVPRWHMLDQLVDRLLAELPLGQDFGGYFRC